MNVDRRWDVADQLWGRMQPLLERLLAAPCAPRKDQQIAPKPGVYLFSDGARFRYVGQTRNLRARLGQHTQPGGTHYSATLAFLMATEDACSRGLDVKRPRAVLEKDVAFAECFARAKETVAGWGVQVAEEDDPDVRTVFEVYAHLVLGTDLNTFETH